MTAKQLIPFASGLPKKQTNEWLEHLQLAIPEYEIRELTENNLCQFQQTDVAVVANPDVSLLTSLPRLKWVQSLWAGVEGLVSLLPKEVLICRMADTELQKSMSEATLTWSLYLHRHMHLYREQQRVRVWQQYPIVPASQRNISILGLGVLGQAACQRLQLNGFAVKAWSRTEKKIPGLHTFFGNDGLKEVLCGADIVILLLPLTHETRHLINEQTIRLVKPGGCIINFARGGVIKRNDLVTALKSGALSHAVLDVFDTEPLPKEDSLWEMENVTVLPHISAPTNMISASEIAATNIRNWLQRGELPKLVDRDAGY